MNGHSEILNNVFNLLAIASSIAAFVPALVYSYFTNFTDKMANRILKKNGLTKDNGSNNDENWIKKIVGFSLSLDLILVLIIFVIFFTSVINFLLFIYSHLHENPHLSILSKSTLLSLIVIISFSFIIISIVFWIYTSIKTNNWYYKKYWLYKWWFINIPFFVVSGYASLILSFSLKLCYCDKYMMDNELMILATSTVMIIFLVVIWIIPIFVYKPLFSEIEHALKKFDPKPEVTNEE